MVYTMVRRALRAACAAVLLLLPALLGHATPALAQVAPPTPPGPPSQRVFADMQFFPSRSTVEAKLAIHIDPEAPAPPGLLEGAVLRLLLPADADHIEAATPDGRQLQWTIGPPAEPVRSLNVYLAPALGPLPGPLDVTVTYTLGPVHGATAWINASYASIPVPLQLIPTLVRVRSATPAQINPLTGACASDGSTVWCGAAPVDQCRTAVQQQDTWRCAAAVTQPRLVLVEAVAASPAAQPQPVTMTLPSGGSFTVFLRPFVGDDYWPVRVSAIAREVLPAIERLNGFPYAGPKSVEVVESPIAELQGYGGEAQVSSSSALLRVTPSADAAVMAHELAHLWSFPYRDRWQREGMAEYTAQVALHGAAQTTTTLAAHLTAIGRDPNRFPLSRWDALISLLATDSTARDRTLWAYEAATAVVARIFQLLPSGTVERAALTAMTNGQAIGTRAWLDALEPGLVRDEPLDALFADWVLPPSDAGLLKARRAARARVAYVTERLDRADLAMPPAVHDALVRWDFSSATALADALLPLPGAYAELRQLAPDAGQRPFDGFTERLAAAQTAADVTSILGDIAQRQDALRALIDATNLMNGPRTFWQRAGLFRSDVARELVRARSLYARGDPAAAAGLARSVSLRVQESGREGERRVAAGGAIALAVLALLSWPAWCVSRHFRSASVLPGRWHASGRHR